jgi:DNA (cytosine-5)-methyltransferase 1
MVVNVVSFFCGCGGSSLGYKLAGCDVRLASDFNPRALETYRMNFPDIVTLLEDIRNVRGGDVLELAGLGELDILDGSPPCTPFSMSGDRERTWNRVMMHTGEHRAQRTDDLFFEYVRLISEIRPRAFVAENVSGLVKGNAKIYYNEIVSRMKGAGYAVKPYLLNAADFEVPQSRERVMIVGVRKDIPINGAKLAKHPKISFLQAVRELPRDAAAEARLTQAMARSFKSAYTHYLRQGEAISRYHPKGFGFNFSRVSLHEPCPTVTDNWIIHPTENRRLTLAEVMRCSSFPDWFRFLSEGEGYMRLANSVPPNLIKNVAKYVIELAGLNGTSGDPKGSGSPRSGSPSSLSP